MSPLLIVILALVGVGIYYWYTHRTSSFEATPIPAQPKPPSPSLVLFYSHGCGHCHHLMPTWNKVEEHLRGKMDTRKIEMSEPEAAPHAGTIRGVPTIRLYPQGLERADNYMEYKGDRSLEDIMRFSAVVTSS